MEPQAAGSDRGRIPTLDGWRAVSILLVIAGHLLYNRHANLFEDSFEARLAETLADAGVSIFFTISGFIITLLALNERERDGRFSPLRFYLRRVFRIVPPFYLYLTFVVLAATFGLIATRRREALTAALFLCNLPGATCRWFTGHSWSLATEEQFYALFPLLWLLPRRYAGITLGSILGLFVAAPWLRYLLHLGPGWFTLLHGTLNFSFICIGVLLAMHSGRARELARGPWGALLGVSALLLLPTLVCLNAAALAPHAWVRLIQARMLLAPVITPFVVATLLAWSVYHAGWIAWLLEIRWLKFVGTISYSLYLWQELFSGLPGSYPVASPLLLPPLMFVFATASYYFIERPFIALGRHVTAALDGRWRAIPAPQPELR